MSNPNGTTPDLLTSIAEIKALLDLADQPDRGYEEDSDRDPEYEARERLPEVFRCHDYDTDGERPVGTVDCGSAGFEETTTPVALYRLLFLFSKQAGCWPPGVIAPHPGHRPWPIDFGDMYKSKSLFAICSPDYHFHAGPQFYKYELALYLCASKAHVAGREHGVTTGVPGADNGIQAASEELKAWWALLLRCLNRKWLVYSGNDFTV